MVIRALAVNLIKTTSGRQGQGRGETSLALVSESEALDREHRQPVVHTRKPISYTKATGRMNLSIDLVTSYRVLYLFSRSSR